ncbi:MAG TPA: hypothetical protein VD772_10595, partial [Anseongella sp.]|nr:hypothetical protein [Anseongella sp.]
MKIRFKGNTIRYRLDQIDVESVRKHGICQEKLTIGPNVLTFTLESAREGHVTLEPFSVRTGVISSEMSRLTEGPEVSLELNLPQAGGRVLKILVE